MQEKKRIKKSLLQWMEGGDHDLVPVMMADAESTAASYFGVPVRTPSTEVSFTEAPELPVTPAMVIKCCRETGLHFKANLGQPGVFDAIEFIEDMDLKVKRETAPDGTLRRFTTLHTPKGELHDIFETPPDRPAMWTSHLVKTEKDLPAFAYFIEKASVSMLEDVRVREKITSKLRKASAKWPAEAPLSAIVGVPAFGLMSSLFMGAEESAFFLADNTALMEGLFEMQTRALKTLVECAAEAGADFLTGAINGLELFSPAMYRKYFIPQAKELFRMAHGCGMRGWVHTCGYLDRLIDAGVYEEMDVDILESFSHPPLGDVGNLRAARSKLGRRIITRGAVNVDLFYDSDLEHIRNRTVTVLEETAGYPHMLGDTNDSYPPYPWKNIRALLEAVQKSGRFLPIQI
ncbi:MAG: hypothetical protein JW957_07365 [Candidatus Omnitrophica bacterium]|nr:hypothetical protein [Candidatus Omnitrophota bacterium]